MKKVGLFFGSFNPIHKGHLIVAQSVLEEAQLQEIWFVVSPQNPFKPSSSLLHEFDRYEMVRLAIHDNYQFKVSDIEFNMPKPSYTIDTLTYIQDQHKQTKFYLIIGQDNLAQFGNWKNHLQILEHFSLLVYPRANNNPSPFDQHPKVKFIQAPLLNISATYIRKLLKENKKCQIPATPLPWKTISEINGCGAEED